MATTSGRARRGPSGGVRRERGAGWALLAETMLVGVVTLPALVLVVPFPAAVAAGSAHLRRHVSGRPDDLRRLVRELLAALRPLAPVGAGLLALLALGTVNLLAAASGALAGGRVVAVVTLVVLAAAIVVGLRAGAAWSDADGTAPGAPPRARHLVSAAVRRSVADPSGSVLLVAAVAAAAVFVWSLAALLVVVGGLLCLAVVGVEARRPADAAS